MKTNAEVRQVRRLIGAMAIGLGCALNPAQATADVSEASKVTAEALFNEARRLMDAGQYAEACGKFRDSNQLDPGVGTLLNLALCYKTNGQTARAWTTYKEAAAAARDAGQTEREAHAREEARSLEPTLSRLKVVVAPAARVDGLEIKLDGETVLGSAYDVPMPVDPGQHEVVATAPGRRLWRITVEIEGTGPVSVKVPELSPQGASPDPLPAPPTAAAPVAGTPAAPPHEAGAAPAEATPEADAGVGDTQRTIGLVVGGMGLAAVAGGLYVGYLAGERWDESQQDCTEANVCLPDGAAKREAAEENATISNITVGVGLAALTTGVVLYLTAPSSEASDESARLRRLPSYTAGVSPGVGGAPWVLTLKGAW